MIVPTSRGVSCGVNVSRTWLISAIALSKICFRDYFGVHVYLLVVSALGFSSFGSVLGLRFRLCFGFSLGFSFDFRLGFEFGFRFGFVFALGYEVCRSLFRSSSTSFPSISDNPRCSTQPFARFVDEFNAADQVSRGLKTDVDIGREGFVQRILYRCALLRGQVKRARTSAGSTLSLRAWARPAGLDVHLFEAAGECSPSVCRLTVARSSAFW